MNSDLKPREQCISVKNKANRVLSFINGTVTNRSADVILRLYLVLIRPHLDYAVQFWCPHYRMDKSLLESVQRRMTKMIQGLRNLPYQDRLKHLNLHSLEERSVRGKLKDVFKWVKGFNKSDISKVLRISQQDRMRNNGFKLEKYRFRREIGRHWFSNRVVDKWNKLSNHIVRAGTRVCFKSRLDNYMDQDER